MDEADARAGEQIRIERGQRDFPEDLQAARRERSRDRDLLRADSRAPL